MSGLRRLLDAEEGVTEEVIPADEEVVTGRPEEELRGIELDKPDSEEAVEEDTPPPDDFLVVLGRLGTRVSPDLCAEEDIPLYLSRWAMLRDPCDWLLIDNCGDRSWPAMEDEELGRR